MRFNFGHYLNSIMPQKRMAISREEFLSSIYDPIIEKYDIVDKNGEPYLIGRELTSNLFRCTSNLPLVLQKAFERADNERELFYNSFKEAFSKLYSYDVLFEYTGILVREIVSNKPFSKQLNQKFADELIKEDPYQIHWFLFKTLGAMENRIITPLRKQGRPSKNTNFDDFFYLSEETKIVEFKRMVNTFSKEKSSISYNEFRYFLNALAYVDDNTTTIQKNNILLNILPLMENDNHLTTGENLQIYFENARDTLGSFQIYNNWIKLIPSISIRYEIKILKKLYESFINSGNPSDLRNRLDKSIDKERVLNNETFKQQFVKNKFFLPDDFLGTINQELWSYCHYIAVLASKADLKKEFIEEINLIRANNENNRTVNDRCDALIEKCTNYIVNSYF